MKKKSIVERYKELASPLGGRDRKDWSGLPTTNAFTPQKIDEAIKNYRRVMGIKPYIRIKNITKVFDN